MADTYYRVTRGGGTAGGFVRGTRAVIDVRPDGSTDGEYTVEYYSTDNVGNKEEAQFMTVVVDTVASLELGFGNVSTGEGRFRVAGRAEPGSTVYVNGKLARVDPDGSFSTEVGLRAGANIIVVKSLDPAGNERTETRVVTYTRPGETSPTLPVPAAASVVAVLAAIAVAMAVMRGLRRRPRRRPRHTSPPPPLP
ncbi:MAG: hypothetical protein QXH42_04340 [Thermoplasmata archaeon]